MSNIKSDRSKNWWKDINDITGRKSRSDNLQGMANAVCEGNIQVLVNMIDSATQEVTAGMTPITPSDSFTIGQNFYVPSTYIIPVHKVQKQLENVKTDKAVGPDKIPNWLLKGAASSLAPAVCSIFNASIRDGVVPQTWKSADICPIGKVPRPTRVDKDLRPISLTPVLSKCLEHHPKRWIMNAISSDLDPGQYGSLPGSSTTLALVELLHLWLAALEKPGHAVRVLLLDFRKAFDLVDHHVLLKKLANTALPDYLVKWVQSFLCQRKQRIKLNNTFSEWSNVRAGVPQGTLLGPTSFLLHINDLQTICKATKYVDDASIWEECNYNGKDSKLQMAADQASEWSLNNNMLINTEKTKELIIYFGKRPSSFEKIKMLDNQIETVECTKLLGVTINNKLTWHDHVEQITSKAASRLYFLRMLRRTGIPSKDIFQVFTSIIRPILEYACEVWHPGLTKAQTQKLEHIQTRAMRIIHPDASYEEALERLSAETQYI